MHPLHEYIAKAAARELRSRRVVVWYDPPGEFARFVRELRGAAAERADVAEVTVDGVAARLVEFRGSFFEVRVLAEPSVCADTPDAVIVYVPGQERDAKASVLMELELAGALWAKTLRQCARSLFRERYTLGVVDELVPVDRAPHYNDLARISERRASGEPPSILKVIFHEAHDDRELLAAWLASDARDAEVEAKGGARELAKLVTSCLGLALAEGQPLAKQRLVALRYVLAGEFRLDLRCAPPATLDAIPAPETDDAQAGVRAMAQLLRTAHAGAYRELAMRVEQELRLDRAGIAADALGSIDTFSFEERALLSWCGDLLAGRRFEAADAVVRDRAKSFWRNLNEGRQAQWEACRQMAELGRHTMAVRAALAGVGGDPAAWVEAYTAREGWHQMDGVQRRLEALVMTLAEEPEERALGVVRQLYEETCLKMAEGFTRALAGRGWIVRSALHQTGVYGDVVAAQPKPVAYFLVDAMRYEMGVELAERLPTQSEVTVRHAIGVLPSITTAGMAALMPGASGSFSLETQKGKLGARIEDAFLPDASARKKFATSRVPGLVDLSLDDLLTLPPSKLKGRVENAQVVIVRSQEIDAAGEGGFTSQARQVMDLVISNVARAIGKLAKAGVEHAVVSADHGHLILRRGS